MRWMEQAWHEHEYDTRLLNKFIAFPILRELVNLGDAQAKKVFKDEIYNRFQNGSLSARNFLMLKGYLRFLQVSELEDLLIDEDGSLRDEFKMPKDASNDIRFYYHDYFFSLIQYHNKIYTI